MDKDKKKLLLFGGAIFVLIIVAVVIFMMSKKSPAPKRAPAAPGSPSTPTSTGNLQIIWTSPKGQKQSYWLGVSGTDNNYTLVTHLVQSKGSVWQVDPATNVLFTLINGTKYAIDNSRWDLPPPSVIPYDSSKPSAFCILGRQSDVNTGEIFNAIMYNSTEGCLMSSGGAYPQAFIYNCSGDSTQQSVLLNNQVQL